MGLLRRGRPQNRSGTPSPAVMKVSAATLISLCISTAICVATNGLGCDKNSDCPAEEACLKKECGNPCQGICWQDSNCKVDNHNPICECPAGYTGDPFVWCTPISGMCPPLTDPSRDINCTFQSQDADCKSHMAPGTKASVMCKTFFEDVPSRRSYETTCNENGRWSREVQPCDPECGKVNPRGLELLSNAERTKIAEYPWHVGLYRNISGEVQHQCGGSLISTRVIVTAAHCFAEETIMERIISEYKVVAGKYYREWNITTKYTQYLEVEKVVRNSQYRAARRNYESDIAVIILKHSIRIDEAVRPVCFDFDETNSKYFTPGIVGKVLGWGFTETQNSSDVLLSAELSYVNSTECEMKTPGFFHDFILKDKFCAGKKDTTVCQGDSGGGYVVQFPRNSKWYLVGVVSIGPTANCSEYPYAAFTNLYSHLEFIRQYYIL